MPYLWVCYTEYVCKHHIFKRKQLWCAIYLNIVRTLRTAHIPTSPLQNTGLYSDEGRFHASPLLFIYTKMDLRYDSIENIKLVIVLKDKLRKKKIIDDVTPLVVSSLYNIRMRFNSVCLLQCCIKDKLHRRGAKFEYFHCFQLF